MNKLFISIPASLLAVALLLGGCAIQRPETDPTLDLEAASIVQNIRRFNSDITSSKGSGWARVTTAGKSVKYRIAWAAVFPDKLRFTLLLSGVPVETVIANGQTISFISHTGEHKNYTFNSTDPDFKSYMDVPVKASQMICLLLARLPLMKFDDVYFSPEDPALSNVTLSKKWKSAFQVLTIDSKKMPVLIQNHDGTELISTLRIKAYKDFDQRRIPAGLEFTDSRSGIQVTVTRFVVNPEIKESVFRLTPNGS